MTRFVFNVAVDNRFGGIDLGFVTGEEIVRISSSELVGRFQTTLFGEVTVTAIGDGLRLNGNGILVDGFLNSSTITAGGRVLVDVSDIDLPVREAFDIITGRSLYRGADVILGSSEEDELAGFRGADFIRGGGGADLLFGNAGADRLIGGAGADTISGGGGADRIAGGGGGDRLEGGGGGDVIIAGASADDVQGGGGADSLSGGGGRDTLDGGRGADMLTGGGGRDTFVFSRGQDTITDFSAGDRIDLSDQFFVTDFETLVESNLFDSDDGAVIRISGSSLLLSGVATGELDENDFLFLF